MPIYTEDEQFLIDDMNNSSTGGYKCQTNC
jgi:hypothetical protein